MKSLRLITVHDDGRVEWTPERMDEIIEGRQAAIQRLLIQLLNTPGTYIENAQFGGGIPKLMDVSRGTDLSDVKLKVADKVQRVNRMLQDTEPERQNHTITDVNLRDVTRKPERGLSIELDLHFYGASPFQMTLPVDTNGT